MKMTIRKSNTLTIDFSYERERIKKAFRRHGKDGKKIRQQLNHLMDLIETKKWSKAAKFLETKWWKGHDPTDECPRCEFIGAVPEAHRFGNAWMSYADLVWAMLNRPDVYQVIEERQ
jgi:hypothetical protein